MPNLSECVRTPKSALKDLLNTPRLRFGDESQIEALAILRLAEELLESPRVCPERDGEGEVENDEPGECDKCGHECSHCSGDGEMVECYECSGSGDVLYTRDQVYDFSARAIYGIILTSRKEAA